MWEGPSATREFDVVAFTAEVNQWGEGVRLGLAPNARYAASEFAGTKYLSWSENLVRYERAHESGFDEVVLLNERGDIAECTSANIFTVHGSQVWTPPLSAGCLPGVTRALLLEIPIEGLKIGEKTLLPADLEAADEVFLTSTTRELLPVYSVEGLKIRRSQSAMDQCQRAFSEYVSQYLAAHRRPASLIAK
jgi:branched-chain amino acid aminotransferase